MEIEFIETKVDTVDSFTEKMVIATSLGRQKIVTTPALAEAISKVAAITSFDVGGTLISEGVEESGVHFILSGSVEILVRGTFVATRDAGECIGEMASIEPYTKRCATVKAKERTVTAFVSGEDFGQILKAHPELWRELAVLSNRRLRDRSHRIKSPNKVPRLFIGSSTENKSVVNTLAQAFASDRCEVRPWFKDVFRPSGNFLNSLLTQTEECDFAVIVLGEEDMVRTRGIFSKAPRDNLIFELGLFMGALGPGRTFYLTPKTGVKLPSDLDGITHMRCAFPNKKTAGDFAEAIAQIQYEIEALSVRKG